MPCEIPSTKSWRLTIALRCTTSWVSQGPKLKRLKRHPRHPWLAVKALGSNEAGGRFQRVSWSLAKFATGNVGKTQRMGWLMFHPLILRIRQEVSKRAFLRPSWERHRVHPQLEPLFLVRNYITHQMEVRGPGHYFCCSCEKLRWKIKPTQKNTPAEPGVADLSDLRGVPAGPAWGVQWCSGSIAVHFPLPGSLDAALKSKTAVLRRLVVGIVC